MPNNDMSTPELPRKITDEEVNRVRKNNVSRKEWEEFHEMPLATIQGHLRRLEDSGANPKGREVLKYKSARRNWLDKAKEYDEGKFGKVLEILESDIEQVEMKARQGVFTHDTIAEDILNLNRTAQNLETNARGVINFDWITNQETKAWDPKLNGIGREYVNGTLRTFELAYAEAKASLENDPEKKQVWEDKVVSLKKSIDFLNIDDERTQRDLDSFRKSAKKIAIREIKPLPGMATAADEPRTAIDDLSALNQPENLEEARPNRRVEVGEETQPNIAIPNTAATERMQSQNQAQNIVEALEESGKRKEIREARNAINNFFRNERFLKEAILNRQEIEKYKDVFPPDEKEVLEARINIYDAAFFKKAHPSATELGGPESRIRKIRLNDIQALIDYDIGPNKDRTKAHNTGLEFTLYAIADHVVHRKKMGNGTLNYSLLDCQNDPDFQFAAEKYWEPLIADNILRAKFSNIYRTFGEQGAIAHIPNYADEYELAIKNAQESFNTVINLFYSLNVFEYYNTAWVKDTREKYKESAGKVPEKKLGPTSYDRLVSPILQGSMCPLEYLVKQGIKPDEERPVKPNAYLWIINQTMRPKTDTLMDRIQGRTRPLKFEDFDEMRVLPTTERDARSYWTIRRENGKNVLLVPRIAPIRLGSSGLHANKINVTVLDRNGNPEKHRGKEVKANIPFIEALAARHGKDSSGGIKYQIDWQNPGVVPNFASNYVDDLPQLDIILSAYKVDEKAPIDTSLATVRNALGKFSQGTNDELMAWLFLIWSNVLNPNSRIPEAIPGALDSTRFIRTSMGYINRNEYFNEVKRKGKVTPFNIFNIVGRTPREKRDKNTQAYVMPAI